MITVHTPAGTFETRDEALASAVLAAYGVRAYAETEMSDSDWDDLYATEDTLATTYRPIA